MRDSLSFVLANEPLIRLGAFAAVLAAMAAWELAAPRRARAAPAPWRWINNLGLTALNTLALRVVFPIAAVGFAILAEARGWGLLNALRLPEGVEIVLAIIVLDLALYAQHVMFHAVPLLWRLHRMHHADLDVDVTTGVRFHTLEILLSMIIKIAVVLALGPSALAVVIFEVLLNAAAMFNHANIALPARADRVLRAFIVTPDMHRVHHSIRPEETNSNFGFQVPWWDRLFGTYRAQPADGHAGMTLGLRDFRDPKELRLDRMLAQPFRTPENPDT